ncbi:uncharacterized protein BDV14DRAFT_204846 [Aspergillus stella-maris]|uniref:uncharacterized protein n=1 Tax=Aspergillus stella-maris TaxID=1810926 RepID=UPI003CCDEFA3
MPMVWNDQADAKLLVAILATNDAKLNWAAIAEYMGAGCTISAVQHRIQRLKEKVKAENPTLAGSVPGAGSGSGSAKGRVRTTGIMSAVSTETGTGTESGGGGGGGSATNTPRKRRGRPSKKVSSAMATEQGVAAGIGDGSENGNIDGVAGDGIFDDNENGNGGEESPTKKVKVKVEKDVLDGLENWPNDLEEEV